MQTPSSPGLEGDVIGSRDGFRPMALRGLCATSRPNLERSRDRLFVEDEQGPLPLKMAQPDASRQPRGRPGDLVCRGRGWVGGCSAPREAVPTDDAPLCGSLVSLASRRQLPDMQLEWQCLSQPE